jgi:hypothetical protein
MPEMDAFGTKHGAGTRLTSCVNEPHILLIILIKYHEK